MAWDIEVVDGCAVVRMNTNKAGIASVDLSRPMEGLRELRRAVRQLGLQGLRVLPWLWGLPPDDRRYYPLYAECHRVEYPILPAGRTYRPNVSVRTWAAIPYLDHVAHEFPELVIVGGHIGFPWVSEMISLAMKHPNIYIDTSAYKASRFPRDFVEYMRGPGRREILFGTNYPMLNITDCLADLDQLGLDADTRALFLGGNHAGLPLRLKSESKLLPPNTVRFWSRRAGAQWQRKPPLRQS
jgi:uncharacterized protein